MNGMIANFTQNANMLPVRYLGIDYGAKKVGVAISDESGVIAFPLCVLNAKHHLIDKVLELIYERNVGVVVIGKSMNLKGGLNEIAIHAKKFGNALKDKVGDAVKIVYQDERLSTKQAASVPFIIVGRGDIANKRKKNRVSNACNPVDASAAAIILQSFLDKHRYVR